MLTDENGGKTIPAVVTFNRQAVDRQIALRADVDLPVAGVNLTVADGQRNQPIAFNGDIQIAPRFTYRAASYPRRPE